MQNSSMPGAVHQYREHTIKAVNLGLLGAGWRVEDPGGHVVIHHVGALSLAKGIVDARHIYGPLRP